VPDHKKIDGLAKIMCAESADDTGIRRRPLSAPVVTGLGRLSVHRTADRSPPAMRPVAR